MPNKANRFNHGLTENDVTDQRLFKERRKFIRSSLAAGTGVALASYFPMLAGAAVAGLADSIRNSPKTRGLEQGDELNTFDQITQYNNFYELGTGKEDPVKYADSLVTDPWSVVVDGECNKPGVYTLEDILKPHDLEERIYRLRCVEAWSMVVPWIGFSLGDLLKRFEPHSSAKYVAFETLYERNKLLPGQRRQTIEWPYREGLRMDEAMQPLTMAVVGLYGEVLPNQNGAPLRLVVPWKYGFKSIKSIVKISFVEKEPPTSWNMTLPNEYGFYSNVNPNVDHPRWSQARERRIGEFFKRETLMYNGYPEVAELYAGMDLKQHY